jgi:hypothetical protein
MRRKIAEQDQKMLADIDAEAVAGPAAAGVAAP